MVSKFKISLRNESSMIGFENDLQITSIILLTKPRDMYPKLQLVERCYIHKVNRFHYYHNNDWNKILWL